MDVRALIDLPVPNDLGEPSYALAATPLLASPTVLAEAMAGDSGVERQRWAAQHARDVYGFDRLIAVATVTASAYQNGQLGAVEAVRRLDQAALAQQPPCPGHPQFEIAAPAITPPDSSVDPVVPSLRDVVAPALASTLHQASVDGPEREVVIEHVVKALGAVARTIVAISAPPLVEAPRLDPQLQVQYFRCLQRRRPKDVPPPAWNLACGVAHRRHPPSPSINGRWPVCGPVATWLATGSTEDAAPRVQFRWTEWVKRLLAPASLADAA